MTKLFTCLKGHEWEIAIRKPAYASGNCIVCPVCGGRSEDPPVEIAEKVPPKPDPMVMEEDLARPAAGKGGGRPVLMLFLGFLAGAVIAAGIGFLAGTGVRAEPNPL